MVPGADQRSPALPRAAQQCQVLHVSPQHGPELMLRASQHFLVLPIPSRVCRGAPRLGVDSSAPPDPPAVLMAPQDRPRGLSCPHTPGPPQGPGDGTPRTDPTLGIPWPPARWKELPHGHSGWPWPRCPRPPPRAHSCRAGHGPSARLPASSAQGSPSGSRALHTKHSS